MRSILRLQVRIYFQFLDGLYVETGEPWIQTMKIKQYRPTDYLDWNLLLTLTTSRVQPNNTQTMPVHRISNWTPTQPRHSRATTSIPRDARKARQSRIGT